MTQFLSLTSEIIKQVWTKKKKSFLAVNCECRMSSDSGSGPECTWSWLWGRRLSRARICTSWLIWKMAALRSIPGSLERDSLSRYHRDKLLYNQLMKLLQNRPEIAFSPSLRSATSTTTAPNTTGIMKCTTLNSTSEISDELFLYLLVLRLMAGTKCVYVALSEVWRIWRWAVPASTQTTAQGWPKHCKSTGTRVARYLILPRVHSKAVNLFKLLRASFFGENEIAVRVPSVFKLLIKEVRVFAQSHLLCTAAPASFVHVCLFFSFVRF